MFRSPTGTTVVGLVLAAILLVSVNSLAARFLTGAHFDLTDQKLYTLSDGTKAILGKIDEPITLKLYYSPRLGERVPAYGVYEQQVRELLEEYVARANGKIDFQVLDPQPYSEVEDQATAAGLQGVPLEEGGEQIYFGLLGTNSTDDTETIPFFQQDRERFIEYDITKLVQTLAFPKKKVVGLMTSLAIDSDPLARVQGRPFQPQVMMDQLRQTYEVRDISTTFEKVPDDIDVLMIVQPQNLSPRTQYAIDQWVLNGGHALVFADPNSEFQQNHPSVLSRQGAPTSADFDTLLKAWGVSLAEDKVVGDRLAARRVNLGGAGHPEAIDYVAWLNLQADDIDPNDPVTGKLAQINLASAGALEPLKDAKTKLQWLLRSSTQAELFDAAKAKGLPDVAGLLRDFKPTGQRYTLAARITGVVDTAFPDGRPKEAKADADAKPDDAKKPDAKPDEAKPDADPNQIKTAKQPIDVIVVADSDILDDRFWVQVQDFAGQRVANPVSGNADFVQNAIDSLMGSNELIGLRSRGSAIRPFVLVDQMQHEAEDRYKTREKTLQDELKDTQAKLNGVKGQEDASGNIQLTPEQAQAMDKFRATIISTRAQLRQVQLALGQDIDRLKETLVALDVGLVPLAVALAAIILGIIRLQRRKRGVHSA